MAFGKVIRSFVLKSNSTRNDVILTIPLMLDPNKDYTMRLMSFRFQNVFCNLVGDIIASPNNSWTYTYDGVNYTLPQSNYLTPAIGELDVLFNWIIDMIRKQCNCEDNEINININNYGKIDFSFSNKFTNINFNGGCLSTDYFGMINSITTNDYTSPQMPIVSSFNSILLSCSLCGNSCFVQNNSGDLINTATIVSVNAALEPFELADWSSVQILEFPLNSGGSITGFTVELRDDNNNDLTILEGSTTDFNCWIEIIEK